MLRGMTCRQWSEWKEYASLEPFGEERADLRMGILASLVANIVRKRGHAPMRPQQFMPRFGDSRPRGQTVKEMHSVFCEFAAMHNARLAQGGAT